MTGVQTCALPISAGDDQPQHAHRANGHRAGDAGTMAGCRTTERHAPRRGRVRTYGALAHSTEIIFVHLFQPDLDFPRGMVGFSPEGKREEYGGNAEGIRVLFSSKNEQIVEQRQGAFHAVNQGNITAVN